MRLHRKKIYSVTENKRKPHDFRVFRYDFEQNSLRILFQLKLKHWLSTAVSRSIHLLKLKRSIFFFVMLEIYAFSNISEKRDRFFLSYENVYFYTKNELVPFLCVYSFISFTSNSSWATFYADSEWQHRVLFSTFPHTPRTVFFILLVVGWLRSIERFILNLSLLQCAIECGAMHGTAVPLQKHYCSKKKIRKVSDRGDAHAHENWCRVQQHSCHPIETVSLLFSGAFFPFFKQKTRLKGIRSHTQKKLEFFFLNSSLGALKSCAEHQRN